MCPSRRQHEFPVTPLNHHFDNIGLHSNNTQVQLSLKRKDFYFCLFSSGCILILKV